MVGVCDEGLAFVGGLEVVDEWMRAVGGGVGRCGLWARRAVVLVCCGFDGSNRLNAGLRQIDHR